MTNTATSLRSLYLAYISADNDVAAAEMDNAMKSGGNPDVLAGLDSYKEVADARLADLVAAIAAAPWGRQLDGSFVTDRGLPWSEWRTKNFFDANRNNLVTVEVPGLCGRKGRQPRLVAVFSLAEAKETRAWLKAQARRCHATYLANLQNVARAIAAGEYVEFHPGQEGGTATWQGSTVSARGARRLATNLRLDVMEEAYGMKAK